MCVRECLQTPPTPPVDPENEEFVIFIRSKKVGVAQCTAVYCTILHRIVRRWHARSLRCQATHSTHAAHRCLPTDTTRLRLPLPPALRAPPPAAAAAVGAPERGQGRHRRQPAGQGAGD